MPTPDVDVATIIDVLDRHNVEYVVIGGFAAELHNVAIPPTQDIDITPAASTPNLERLAHALNELDAKLRVPDDPDGVVVPGGISASLLAGLSVLTLITSAGPLDVLVQPQGTDGYADLVKAHVEISRDGRLIPVAALADVIRSKEAAGREKDLKVLPALRSHLRATGG